jgi:hypothetical protein
MGETYQEKGAGCLGGKGIKCVFPDGKGGDMTSLISHLIREWIHNVGGENIEGLLGILGGILVIGSIILIIFFTTRSIIRRIRRS